MISLALIVVVLGVVLSLMFQMRAFAERQQLVTQPRQSARRALDYLGFFVEGASDVNPARNNPNAIVTYWENSNQAFANRTVRQSSYNNLTGAEAGNAVVVSPAPYTGLYTSFGDAGTDVITLAIPTAPIQIPVVNWPGNQHAANFDLDFRGGRPDDTANMNQFQQMTNSDFNGNQAVSGVLQFVDANGTHAYVQFTQYLNSNCSQLAAPGVDPSQDQPIVHVVANPGGSNFVNPPGGQPNLTAPIKVIGGLQFVSFRVRTPLDAQGKPTGPPRLEQRTGMFDPRVDNPGTNFTPVIENVEDMQVAYVYGAPPAGAGTALIYNSASQAFPVAVPNGVPTQGIPGTPPAPWDVSNVLGLRVTLVGRSPELPALALGQKISTGAGSMHLRPASEDRAASPVDKHTSSGGAGLFDHYRMTNTLLLRNRMLGG